MDKYFVVIPSSDMTIKELVKKAHENARKHGFWEDWDSICWEDGLPKREDSTLDIKELFNNAIATRLMLIVSELSEALEALRHDDRDNFAEELADVAIRLADLCGGLGIDLEAEIEKKMEKTRTGDISMERHFDKRAADRREGLDGKQKR